MSTGSRINLGSLIPPALWLLNPEAYSGWRRHLLRSLQTVTLIIRDFWSDRCLLHASSLAFSTILAMVPFFALTFALLKGFGVPSRIEPLILEQVTAGSQLMASRILSFINNTNMGSLGSLGLIGLIITVLSLLGSVEESFNVIWGVREDRTLSRKLSDYLSILIFVPVLILVAISITTFLENKGIVEWFTAREYLGEALLGVLQLVPYVSVWLAFTALYLFVPNTKVRLTSAILGGVLTGTVWQIAQWGYIHFQVGVGRYNAIYGTLSFLPIFMVWLLTSWIIVLLGVEVVYAHQNRRTLRLECHGKELSPAARLELALTLLVECALLFRRGAPLSAEQMALELSLPLRQVKQSLEELERSGQLTRLAGDTPRWHPAQEPFTMPVSDVLHLLSSAGSRCSVPEASRCEELIRTVLTQASSGSTHALEGVTIGTLADLLERECRPAEPGMEP
jgi:membrane protein